VLGKPDAERAEAHHNRFAIRGAVFDDRTSTVAKQPNITVGEKRMHLNAECMPQRADRLHCRDAVGRANVEKDKPLPQPRGYVGTQYFLRPLEPASVRTFPHPAHSEIVEDQAEAVG
jgi:hypothetical protein